MGSTSTEPLGSPAQPEGICISKLQELELSDAGHFPGRANFELKEICHPTYGKAQLRGTIPLILEEGVFQHHSEGSKQKAYNFLVDWLDDHYVDLGTTEERDKHIWFGIDGASVTFPPSTFPLDSPVMLSNIANLILAAFTDELYESTFLTKQMSLVGSASSSMISDTIKPYREVLEGKYKTFAEIPKFDFPMMQPILGLAYLSYEQGQKHRSNYCDSLHYYLKEIDRASDTWMLLADKDFLQRTSTETYTFLRQYDVAGPYLIEVIVITNGIILSKAIRRNLVFKRFRCAFSNAMAYENDVIGVHREIELDQPLNIVLRTLKKGSANTLQKSMEDALNHLEAEIRDVVVCGSKLMEEFPDDDNVERLVHGVKYALDGQIIGMYARSDRYGKPDITYHYD